MERETRVGEALTNEERAELADSGSHSWTVTGWSKVREQKLYSEPFTIGGKKWRLLLFPAGNTGAGTHASLYLGSLDSPSGAASLRRDTTTFRLVLHGHAGAPDISKEISHKFTADDWGYNKLVLLSELRNATRGLVAADDSLRISVQLLITREPNWATYDSKRATGYVGLQPLGATTYLNTLLQMLFHIPAFRKAIYHMPTTQADTYEKSTPLALQALFYKMQFGERAASTLDFTKSFGWNTAREPGDVQAVNRMLCDNLAQKMEGTCVEGALTALFRGETETSVECTDVPYATTKREYFMDLQLDVKGCRDVAASFAKYVEEERLEGDNQFYLHGFGLQNGKKGTRFLHFPPVLQLELKRFEYDFMRDKMGKICDRYEFSEELDLNRFLHVPPAVPGEPPPPPPDARYLLHSVVVHSGDASRAHNYMFVRPNVTGGSSNGDYWLRFTEDRVTRVERVEAVEGNFGVGGGDQDSGNNGLNNESLWTAARRRSSARVLVYVRAADVDKVMCAVTESDIPEHVRERERLEVPRSPVQAAAAASLAAQRPLADDHAANDASTPQRRAATQRPAASIPASAPAAAAVAAALAATLLAAQHPSLADDHAADDASSTPQRSAAPLHSAAPTPESAPAAAAAAAVAVTARAAAHDAAAHSSAGARVRGAAARKSGGAEPLSPAAAAEAAVRADAAAAALLAEEDAATAAREADALKRAARNAKKKDKRRSAAAAAAEEAAAALPAAALQTMRDDAPLPLPAQNTLAASAHAPAPPYDPPHQASSSVPPAASVPQLPTLATAPAAPSPPLSISPPASLVGQQLQPQEQQPPPPPTRSAVHPLWDVSMQPRAPSPPPPPLPSAPAAASVAAPGADELASQLAALEAERTCVVCLDAPRVLLLLPCRHLALCGAPACAAMLGAPPRCPLCRVTIVDMFSVFT